MKIGAHVWREKSLENSVRMFADAGCEAIQIFAANPNAWRSSEITEEAGDAFWSLTEELGIKPVVIHTQYLLNLAAPDAEILSKSRAALDDNMLRAARLGADFVVTHIGSHKGTGLDAGIERICQSVAETLDRAKPGTMLLLENSAGGGNSVGSCFEDIAAILSCLPSYSDRLGVCLDTAHLYGAGFDLSSAEAVAQTFDEFDRIVGFDRLKLLHLNDTNVELGSKRDRHANIGTGRIGEAGFSAVVNHPALRNLAGIIEVPVSGIEEERRDMDILKRLDDSRA